MPDKLPPPHTRASEPEHAQGLPPARPIHFLLFCARQHWQRYGLILSLQAVQACFSMMTPYAISLIVASVATAATPASILPSQLSAPVLLFMAIVLGEMLSARCAGALYVKLLPQQRHAIIRQLTACLHRHPPQASGQDSSGAQAHRIQETAIGVDQISGILLFDFWPGAMALLSAIVLLASTSFTLGAILLLWFVVFAVSSYRLALGCQHFALAEAEARSHTSGVLTDSVANLGLARMFDRLAHEYQIISSRLEHEMHAVQQALSQFEKVRWFQLISAAVLAIASLLTALVLWQLGIIITMYWNDHAPPHFHARYG